MIVNLWISWKISGYPEEKGVGERKLQLSREERIKELQKLEEAAAAQRAKIFELERNDILDETTKKIAEQQKPYQELAVLAAQINDKNLMYAVEQASQAKARKTQTEEQAKLDQKTIEDRKKAEEERAW